MNMKVAEVRKEREIERENGATRSRTTPYTGNFTQPYAPAARPLRSSSTALVQILGYGTAFTVSGFRGIKK